MNPINLRITFSDGTTREVTCIVVDVMKFEEHFDKSVADFQRDIKLSWLIYLAWVAEIRTKVTTLEFEAYAETISGIEVPDPKK